MTDDIPEFLRRKKGAAPAEEPETNKPDETEDDLIGGAPEEPESEPEDQEADDEHEREEAAGEPDEEVEAVEPDEPEETQEDEEPEEEPAKVSGHNKGKGAANFAVGQLKSIVERVERLEEEKKTISGDIKEVYAEAKANGFDTKIIRKIISLRKKDANERQEEEALLDTYLMALGMI